MLIRMDSKPHLLLVAQEIRDFVYLEIIKQIQEERSTLEGNPASKFDGLKLTCRQLHRESLNSVFSFSYTSRQLVRIRDLRISKITFQNTRSLAIEIPLDAKHEVFYDIGSFLQCVQLSLQEFRLFFVGNDQLGCPTGLYGCGKRRNLFPSRHLKRADHIPLLLDQGQDLVHQWELMRTITILRNLRVLQVENANLPLVSANFYNNKPFLQALSVTNDPRSNSNSFSRMTATQVVRLCRSIGVKTLTSPPLQVLSLSANSMSNVEDAINGIGRSLRQLSWSIPNPDLRGYRQHPHSCAYGITNRLIQTLTWKAPKLHTLRLCISFRQRATEIAMQEFATLTANLSTGLPNLFSLKRLEIHIRSGKTWETGFFRHHLIEHLPAGISRLYLSDHTISISELVNQVHKRYFTHHRGVKRGWDEIRLRTPSSPEPSVYLPTEGGDYAEPEAITLQSSCDLIVRGDSRGRHDDIPLSGGNLGFVDFEYASLGDDCNEMSPKFESERAMLIRLNGQLLDRELHLYLKHTQRPGEAYGIRPRQIEDDIWQAQTLEQDCETATSSRHASIYAMIYDSAEMAPKEHLIKQNRDALATCLEYENSKWEWYFGKEDEAAEVFRCEPVAKVEDQVIKSSVMDIMVSEHTRCRWACPDYDVPSVASFPEPVLPHDWKE